MKKLLVLIMSLVMIFTMSVTLTSCNDKSSGDENTLIIWAHNDEDSWTESMKSIADKFMKENPDVKIQFEFFPYDEYESKVHTSLLSEKSDVDIYELWGGWGIDYAPSGALAQLPDSLEKEVRNDAYECTYGALESDGKLYGIPTEFNIECGGLLVNNNLLKENNLTVPKTWDELVADGQKAAVIEDGVMTVKGFDFVNWDGVPYLYTSMILSQGDNYLNEDGSFNFTSAAAKKAFKELASLVTDKKVTDLSGLDDGSDIEGYQQLFAGQALLVPRGPWVMPEAINDFNLKYNEDFSYVEMPWYGSKKAFAAESGWALGVSSKSKKQELAFKFLEYFFSDDVLLERNLACGQIPAKKSIAQSKEYLKEFPYAEPLAGILDDAQFIGYFNTDQFKETINNVFSDYCKGGIYKDADEALKDLETKLDKM